MIGKVVNAIMACTEPKQCSAGLLKNYVVEFHPDFKVAERPKSFRSAVERAEQSGDLMYVLHFDYIVISSRFILYQYNCALKYHSCDFFALYIYTCSLFYFHPV